MSNKKKYPCTVRLTEAGSTGAPADHVSSADETFDGSPLRPDLKRNKEGLYENIGLHPQGGCVPLDRIRSTVEEAHTGRPSPERRSKEEGTPTGTGTLRVPSRDGGGVCLGKPLGTTPSLTLDPSPHDAALRGSGVFPLVGRT